jgi:hypothetical protein
MSLARPGDRSGDSRRWIYTPGGESWWVFRLPTEYENMLQELLDERKTKLDDLQKRLNKSDGDKEVRALVSDMRFIEVELQRYRQGMMIFRTKNLPKVGRWGKPEVEGGHAAAGAP